jgi:hypothetical protein
MLSFGLPKWRIHIRSDENVLYDSWEFVGYHGQILCAVLSNRGRRSDDVACE